MAPVSGGRIRALAVTGSRYGKALPEVASVGEAGSKAWRGSILYVLRPGGPARLPQPVSPSSHER